MKRAVAFAVVVVLKSAWLAVVIWAWPSQSPRTMPVARAAEARSTGDQVDIVFVEPGTAR